MNAWERPIDSGSSLRQTRPRATERGSRARPRSESPRLPQAGHMCSAAGASASELSIVSSSR